jgi:hypothetical protein
MTIAPEESDRHAAFLVPQNRAAGLARSEQAPAPPSAEEQGFRPVTYGAVAAGDAAGLASGEMRDGRRLQCRDLHPSRRVYAKPGRSS